MRDDVVALERLTITALLSVALVLFFYAAWRWWHYTG